MSILAIIVVLFVVGWLLYWFNARVTTIDPMFKSAIIFIVIGAILFFLYKYLWPMIRSA